LELAGKSRIIVGKMILFVGLMWGFGFTPELVSHIQFRYNRFRFFMNAEFIRYRFADFLKATVIEFTFYP